MVISKELELSLFNDVNSIKKVSITYKDGAIVSGRIKCSDLNSNITIEINEIKKDEVPYHDIDFENVLKISLLYYNGDNRIFE